MVRRVFQQKLFEMPRERVCVCGFEEARRSCALWLALQLVGVIDGKGGRLSFHQPLLIIVIIRPDLRILSKIQNLYRCLQIKQRDDFFNRLVKLGRQDRCGQQYKFIEMQGGQHERPHSQSLPKKRSVSGDIQQYQHDAKAYRNLLSLMADNINIISRAHRDCLGEMELQPKIKISREEQTTVAEQLEKFFHQEGEKIGREALNRNVWIRKNYEQYCQNYKNYHPEMIDRQDLQSENAEWYFSEKNKTNVNRYSTISSYKRPLSSKVCKGSPLITMNQVFNAFSAQVGQIYKMKTIEGHFNQNPETKKEKRLVMSTQRGILREELVKAKRGLFARQKQEEDIRRYHNLQEDNIFNGSSIVICDNRPKETEQKSMSQSGKIMGKRMASMKYSQRKSIDQIERMQIQNRINMASSILSVNVPQSQGYRPKSRCWQNYFN